MSVSYLESELESRDDTETDLFFTEDEDILEARSKIEAGVVMLFPERSAFTNSTDPATGETVLFVINTFTDGEFYTHTDPFDKAITEVSFGVRNGKTLLEVIQGEGPGNITIHEVCIGRGEELFHVGELFTANFDAVVTVSNMMKTRMVLGSPTYRLLNDSLRIVPGK